MVRLTDRHNMTIAVYHGPKAILEQQQPLLYRSKGFDKYAVLLFVGYIGSLQDFYLNQAPRL